MGHQKKKNSDEHVLSDKPLLTPDWKKLSREEKQAANEHAREYTIELKEIDKALEELDAVSDNHLAIH